MELTAKSQEPENIEMARSFAIEILDRLFYSLNVSDARCDLHRG